MASELTQIKKSFIVEEIVQYKPEPNYLALIKYSPHFVLISETFNLLMKLSEKEFEAQKERALHCLQAVGISDSLFSSKHVIINIPKLT